jgi:hypothetical protein
MGQVVRCGVGNIAANFCKIWLHEAELAWTLTHPLKDTPAQRFEGLLTVKIRCSFTLSTHPGGRGQELPNLGGKDMRRKLTALPPRTFLVRQEDVATRGDGDPRGRRQLGGWRRPSFLVLSAAGDLAAKGRERGAQAIV